MIIGLTGGLGSGKTTVASMLAKRGARVIDADKVAHKLIQPGHPCFKPILKYFGKTILTKGKIDRRKLAKIVFNHPAKLKKLIGIIHPQVKRELKKIAVKYPKNKLLVLDVPLLFESGIDRMTDLNVVVRSSLKQQIQRTQMRSQIKTEEIKKRIKSQMPWGQKLRRADVVIDNRGTIDQTKQQIEELCLKHLSKTNVK